MNALVSFLSLTFLALGAFFAVNGDAFLAGVFSIMAMMVFANWPYDDGRGAS